VVWSSYANNGNVMAQLFNAAGIPQLATEITVSQTAPGTQSYPDVAMDANGDFVVVWSGLGPSTNTTTNTSDVFYRVFGPTGSALTSQMQANVYATSVQDDARVAMDPVSGGFVIVWTSSEQPATQGGPLQQSSNIFYRTFLLANGAPAPGPTVSLEQQVDVASPYVQDEPDVAMDDNGDFVVVWNAYTGSGNSTNIDGRYYPAGLAGVGGTQFTLNTIAVQQDFTGPNQTFGTSAPLDLWATGPRVAMDITSGNFVATWATYQAASADGYNVYYRQYAATATATPPAPTATSTSGQQIVGSPSTPPPVSVACWQLMPAVSVAPGGAFTVVWTSFGHDNAELNDLTDVDYGIYAEMYTAAGAIIPYTSSTGAMVSGPFRVNGTTIGDQVAPAVSQEDTAANAVIAWDGPLTTATALPTAIFSAMVDPPKKAAMSPAGTTTTLAASAASVAFGQAVTFTAKVTASGSATPTGSVTFMDGTTQLGTGTLSAGTATLTTSALAVASHSITASYVATSSFATSTSAPLTETVTQTGTTTTLTASVASPVVFGQAVTFTATVKAVAPSTAVPTGTVTFKNGTTTLGTGTLSGGTATFTTSALAVATTAYSITASYTAATTGFAASTSAAVLETVKAAGTTTTLTASANPAVFDQAVTFTATVKAVAPSTAVPAGTVTFKNGTTTLGTGTLSGGKATFTTSALAVATTAYSITATYAATTSFTASTSTAVAETVKAAATTTTLTASANPAVFDQAVTFTATVKAAAPSAAVPTGTVTFKNGTATLGTGTLSGGKATFTTSALAVATTAHSITATYAATTDFATSTSAALQEMVNKATTTLKLTTSANALTLNQAVTFTATLGIAQSTASPAGLTVTFKDGTTVLGTAVLNAAGTATFKTSALPAGTDHVTVSYAGSANLMASTSPVLTETVASSTKTVVKSSLVPAAVDQVHAQSGHG
jgi:hypothetical protein